VQRSKAFDVLILKIGEILHSYGPYTFARLLVKQPLTAYCSLEVALTVLSLDGTVISSLRCRLDGTVATAYYNRQ